MFNIAFWATLLFISGILFCVASGIKRTGDVEGFTDSDADIKDRSIMLRNIRSEANTSCPSSLIQHGDQLVLFRDSYLVARFSSIDEYIAYMHQQHRDLESMQPDGQPPLLPCPILYFKAEVNAQGQDVYRELPDPWAEYRKADHARPFDAHGFLDEPGLDQVNLSDNTKPSDNPMDTNWGGVIYSQQAIDSGKYDRRTVGKPVAGVPTVGLPTI
jgi:hypothetical protein